MSSSNCLLSRDDQMLDCVKPEFFHKIVENELGLRVSPVKEIDRTIKLLLEQLPPSWKQMAELGGQQYNAEAILKNRSSINGYEFERRLKLQDQLAFSYLCRKVKDNFDVPWCFENTFRSGIMGSAAQADITLFAATQVSSLAQVVSFFVVRSRTCSHTSAVDKLLDQVHDIFHAQPSREKIFTALVCKEMVDILIVGKDGLLRRSGVTPLALSETSRGLELLVGMLLTPCDKLGYMAPNLPILKATLGGAIVKNLMLVSRKNGLSTKRRVEVYHCEYERGRQSAMKVALKLGMEVEEEAAALTKLENIDGVVRLIDIGESVERIPFLITFPFGEPLHFDCNATVVIGVIAQAARILGSLYEKDPPVLHRDVSFTDILFTQESGRITTYLTNFETANFMEDRMELEKEQFTLLKTSIFSAFSVLTDRVYSFSADLESLMYILCYVAMKGKVPWLKQSIREIAAFKYMVFHNDNCYQREIESHCQGHLAPALRALRGLFFTPQYKRNVQVEDFLQAIGEASIKR